VQPKIQKWIADSAEEDASGGMDRLLMMNDLINNVLNRYEAFKKGDRSATAEIDPAFAPGTQTSATAKAKAAAAQVSLIDFDFDEGPSPAAASTSTNPIDDLSGLGALSLGPSSPSSSAPPTNGGSLFDLDFSSPAPPTPTHNGGFSVPSTAQPQPQLSASAGAFFSNPAYGNGLGGSARGSAAPSPAPSGSHIPWSTTATDASSSRASTPGMAGAAIQLPGSRPGSVHPGTPGAGGAGGASPWDGMAAFGHQQSQVTGAPPVPTKDAFEDLLL